MIRYAELNVAPPAIKPSGKPRPQAPAPLDCETWPIILDPAATNVASKPIAPQTTKRPGAKTAKGTRRKPAKPRTAENQTSRHKHIAKPIKGEAKTPQTLSSSVQAPSEPLTPLAHAIEASPAKSRKAPVQRKPVTKATPAKAAKGEEKSESPLAEIPLKKANGRSASQTATPATNGGLGDTATKPPVKRGPGNRRLTDPDAYRAYQRELMRKRRALAREAKAGN